MRIYVDGRDISEFVTAAKWSGDYTQCTRSLDFGIREGSGADTSLGKPVTLYENGTALFFGYIFGRDRSSDSKVIDVRCRDRGIYLKKNMASYSFSGASPESIARKVCGDFGIPVTSLAAGGVAVTRVFMGDSLYDIIMTAYTEAAKKNGKKYGLRFDGGGGLVVFEKTVTADVVLDGNKNLINAAYSESNENMINRVAIYSPEDKFVKYVSNDEYIRLYGVMQGYLKQTKDDNKQSDAEKMLRDHGVERKVTVENFGDISCITGGCVIVKEPVTGLYGSFFIDGDTHTWKNGLYLNKLTLNFENMMDEKQVGSLPKENKKTKKK